MRSLRLLLPIGAKGFSVAASTATLLPGASLCLERIFTAEDVHAFASLTGDSNPVHQPGGGAAGGAIVPGMLTASMFASLIGSSFPGALYLSQTLKFKATAAVRPSAGLP